MWSQMDSEKWQRVQRQDLIGETLEAEDLQLEHTVKKKNENLTVIKKTAFACVKDLKESITAYLEDSARYYFFCSQLLAAFQSFTKK